MNYTVNHINPSSILGGGRNANNKVVGKCSKCGGVVSTPIVIWTVDRVAPRCEDCGAVADETANLPVIPMR